MPSLQDEYFARVDELEAREAALEAAVAAGESSAATLAELEVVRSHLDWYLEGLDQMGAFNPEPEEFHRMLHAAKTSCSS